MGNDLRLERSRAIAAELQAHDRRRLARHEYDPSDLTPSPKDPSILVSDAGLDRGTIELLRHLDLELEGIRTTRYDAGRAKPHLRNRAETPLDEYRNRRLLAPEDEALNRIFWRAGRRLRADWTTARYAPRVTANLMKAVGGGRTDRSECEAALDAVDRLAAALRPIPMTLRACLVAVCCTDEAVTTWAKRRTWPPVDAAMTVLRIGLEALHAWYSQMDRSAGA
jgi:hypothetical protein